jgi:two-component system, LytTR family, sensor histidine kinase AlgZ
MSRQRSINQNSQPDVLPNFRSLGVALRTLLLVNGMALLVAIAQSESWRETLQHTMEISALLQPVLLSSLLLLFAVNPWFARLSYRQGVAAVILLVVVVMLGIYRIGGELYAPAGEPTDFRLWRNALLSVATAALLLGYFRLRTQALSPALAEARLQALQTRIRPHFLFNTINAVLGIVRAEPRRAETALQDMSDLFRMAMGQNGDLVPVRQEVTFAHQYLALEQLRLGERLRVDWHAENLPEDALMPPLMLQPLLENAVYHGIEPLAEGGVIDVRLYRHGNEIHLEMYNPRQEQGGRHAGHKIALDNIRERLVLQFDIEAHYTVETGKDFYRVHIMLPYIREEKP